jgi:MFS family permease
MGLGVPDPDNSATGKPALLDPMQHCATLRIAAQATVAQARRRHDDRARYPRQLVAAMLRSNPALRRLLGAWVQSCLGTGAGYVALLLLTYRYLHSSWAIAAVLLADFLPAIAFGSWFGAFADRYPKRPLIVTANLLQAAAFAGLALAHTAVPILTLALAAGVGNALQRPALRSALPVIAGEGAQLAAALYDTCRWVGLTAGPLVAAGLFALSGVALPLALNGLSFLIAAAVMATVVTDGPAPTGVPEVPVGSGLRVGLAEAFAAAGIVAVVACSAGSIVAGGLLNVCEPILATRALHGSGSDYALLVASYGAGMVTASALVARGGDVLVGALIRRYLAGLTLTAAGMGGSAIVGSVPAAAAAFATTGFANALVLVSETQLIQLRVPRAVQGRLFGAKDAIEGACFLVGLLGAAALVAAAGVRSTLVSGAVICGVCAVAAVAALRAGALGQPPGPGGDADLDAGHAAGAPAPASPPLP